jgi:MFS family permease
MLNRYTFGRRASFWTAAAVVAHTLWTSAAPAMTYPLYASEWGLTPFATTAIFAIYPIVVVLILVCFGDISDYIGRRKTMLFGLAASLVGVLLFAIAPNVVWVFIGRAFMGVGVGLSAGPSAAAVVEFSAPGQAQKASAITTLSQVTGLICAALVGGCLIQYAPLPTRLNFIVLFGVLMAIFAATCFLPRHMSTEAAGRWRLKAIVIPRGLRKIFAASTIAVTSSYAMGTIILSLGAQIAHDVIGSPNAMVNGAVIALFAFVGGAVAIPARGLKSATTIVIGGLSSVAAVAFLALSAREHSLAVFTTSLVFGGMAYSLLFSGGLGLLNANAPAHHRGGTLSALFLVAYLAQGVAALLLGKIATVYGLEFAIDVGALIVATLSLASILLAILFASPKSASQPFIGTRP